MILLITPKHGNTEAFRPRETLSVYVVQYGVDAGVMVVVDGKPHKYELEDVDGFHWYSDDEAALFYPADLRGYPGLE